MTLCSRHAGRRLQDSRSVTPRVGVGIKVGIECTVMATDSGLVSIEEDVIAIAEQKANSIKVLGPNPMKVVR